MTAPLLLAGQLRNLSAVRAAAGHAPSAALHLGHALVLERQTLCAHSFDRVSCTPFSLHDECRCGATREVAP